MTRLLIGTASGLLESIGNEPTPDPGFGERDVTAVLVHAGEIWAIADGRSVMRRDRTGTWTEVAESDEFELACALSAPDGLILGTEGAHLLRLGDDHLVRDAAFDAVEGRERWYTPWGGPPAVRSMAVDLAGRVHVNVHVGGISRSSDGGAIWESTIDIDTDVHQVVAHPTEPDVVLAAGAVGLAVSSDGGDTWRIERGGLHSAYARAVAVAGDAVLLTTSDGPRGGRAAIYRTSLDPGVPLEKCTDGLPEWFDGSIDSGWLVALGSTAAFATNDGCVFASDDAGRTWNRAADGLPGARWLCFA